MPSERDIEAAHPDAFDFVWGNLPAAKRAEFNRHLSSCPHCHAVVTEYSEIGRIIKLLPPHVEPTADLEDRTVAAMVAALVEQRAAGPARPSDVEDPAATRLYPVPQPQPQPPAEPETQVRPIPQLLPSAEDEARLRQSPVDQPAPAETAARPMVTRLPVWRRYRGRLAAAVVAAAAIITAAIVIPISISGSRNAAQATVVIPLHGNSSGQGEWLRSSHRASDGPSGCLRQLGYHLDRASPQKLRGCEVVPMLVRQHKAWASGLGWHVPRPG